MAHTATISVTEKDPPPSDERPLARWFDQRRFKFGGEEWFVRAEMTFRESDVSGAHQLAEQGVRSKLTIEPPPIPAAIFLGSLNANLKAAQERADRKIAEEKARVGVPPTPPLSQPTAAPPAVAAPTQPQPVAQESKNTWWQRPLNGLATGLVGWVVLLGLSPELQTAHPALVVIGIGLTATITAIYWNAVRVLAIAMPLLTVVGVAFVWLGAGLLSDVQTAQSVPMGALTLRQLLGGVVAGYYLIFLIIISPMLLILPFAYALGFWEKRDEKCKRPEAEGHRR
jgi:hypothetical protein